MPYWMPSRRDLAERLLQREAALQVNVVVHHGDVPGAEGDNLAEGLVGGWGVAPGVGTSSGSGRTRILRKRTLEPASWPCRAKVPRSRKRPRS